MLAKAEARFEAGQSSVELKISLIDDGERLRPVDPAAVNDLAVSIGEGSLAHPITVRPRSGRFELVVGAHRLAAYRQLGRTTIPAQIRTLTDLEARQLEIDENLIRSGLTALDRMTAASRMEALGVGRTTPTDNARRRLEVEIADLEARLDGLRAALADLDAPASKPVLRPLSSPEADHAAAH